MSKRREVITVRDEDGRTHEFSLVDVLDVGAHRYAILQPPDAAAAVVFRIEEDTLIAIDDDAEFEQVVEAIQTSNEYGEVMLLGARSADLKEGELGSSG